MRRMLAVAAVLALSSIPAAAGSATRPSTAPVGGSAVARTWAVHVALMSDEPHTVRLAGASASSGASVAASAAPAAMNGGGRGGASASRGRPDVTSTPMAWTDPTGSMSLEGWFAEAHAREESSSSRTGFGAMTGSGFAMANELLTWEQQEQLLARWTQTAELVAAQVNAAISPIAPALRAIGLDVPHVEAPPAVGFVDFAGARQVASLAEASSGTGIDAARAETSIARLSMLAGFLEFDDVASEATSERAGDEQTFEARATIGRVRVAGIDARVDEKGLHLGSGDLVSRSVIAPTFDALLESLAVAGITVRAAAVRGDDATGLRQADALEISMATPAGTILISVAHAEAQATASTEAPAPPDASTRPAAPATTPDGGGDSASVVTTAGAAHGVARPSVSDAASPSGEPTMALGPVARTLPSSAVRALRTTFLALMVGGVLAALLLPMVIGSTTRTKEVPR